MSYTDYDPSYDVPQTGSFTAAAQTFELDPLQKDTQAVSILGIWVGTIVFEATNDGNNFFSIKAYNVATDTLVTSTTANGNFLLLSTGYSKTRLRASVFTSGTASLSNEGSHGVQVMVATSANAASFLATVSQSGTWNINNISGTVSLPTGAATAALQTQPGVDIGDVTINNAAGGSAVNIQDGGNSITVDGTVSISGSVAVTGPLTDTQLRATAVPVSAATLPLPSGAATSTLQTTGNTSLSSIDTKTPALGQALAAGSTPVVLTAAQVLTLTPLSTVTVIQPTGSNLHVAVDSLPSIPAGANAIGSVSVSNFPATQNVAITSSVELEVKNDTGNPLSISAASLPLPSGAATAANQATEISSLSSIDTKTPALVSGRQPVDGSGVTQPISAVSLPLPTGASTATLQTTGNASLASIDAGIPAALGAAIISASMPVTIASDQTVPVSAVSLPLPTGAATATNQSTEIASLSSIDTKLTSQATAANQATQTTSLQLIDDAVNAPNTAVNKGNPIMGQLDDTSTVLATEDNVSIARITAQRALHVNFRDATGVEGGTPTNPLSITPVDGNNSGTISTNGDIIAVGSMSKFAGVVVSITGTFSTTLTFQGSIDGTNFFPVAGIPLDKPASLPSATWTTTGYYYVPSCFTNFKVNSSGYVSGTVSCVVRYQNTPVQIQKADNILDASGLEGAISVSTTAVAVRVGAANLARRQSLTALNNGTATIYWGYTSSVTSTTGTPLMRNQYAEWSAGPNTTIFLIAASGSHNVRVTEAA